MVNNNNGGGETVNLFWGDTVATTTGRYGVIVAGADNGDLVLESLASNPRKRERWNAPRAACRLITRRAR